MERNYNYLSSNKDEQLMDLTDLRLPALNLDAFTMQPNSPFIKDLNQESPQRRTKQRQVNKVLTNTENTGNTDILADTSCSNKYQYFRIERPKSHRVGNLSNTTNDSFKRDFKVNRNADPGNYLKKTTTDSEYSRSMKAQQQLSASEIKQTKRNTEGQSRFGPSTKHSGLQKQKINFRQTLGSLGEQIKSTLRNTANNDVPKAIVDLPNRLRSKTQTDNFGQSSTKKNYDNQGIVQIYTRYENTPSFLLNIQTNRLKRSKLSQMENKNIQDTFKMENKQNRGLRQTPTIIGQTAGTQIQKSHLGKSLVTQTFSQKDSVLKNSLIMQPLIQFRNPKRLHTYNLGKSQKSYSAYQQSFKKESPSSISRSKIIGNVGLPAPKSIFSQNSLSSHFSKQRDSLGSSQRQSIESCLSLNDFQLGNVKGEGRFGKFYPAIHKKTGLLFGIKQIKKQSLKNMLDQFIQQLKIQSFIEHSNIVKLYGYFCSKQNFYLILEYMQEGSLFSFIKKNKKIKQEQSSTKLKQICSAVEYLHENQILHRDIKPQNIVITCDVCKLCDFGWAVYSNTRRRTNCGTLDYVCPEILQGDSYDSCVDIWAIGVLAYEMIVGKAPFYNISRKQTMKKIMECDFQLPKQLGAKSKQFISNALNKNPNQRSSIDALVKHQFLN